MKSPRGTTRLSLPTPGALEQPIGRRMCGSIIYVSEESTFSSQDIIFWPRHSFQYLHLPFPSPFKEVSIRYLPLPFSSPLSSSRGQAFSCSLSVITVHLQLPLYHIRFSLLQLTSLFLVLGDFLKATKWGIIIKSREKNENKPPGHALPRCNE